MDFMQKQNDKILLEWAKKYIWWENPEEAIKNYNKIILKVLDIGTFEDTQFLLKYTDKNTLAEIIQNSGIGSMRKKSWNYWHIILDICDDEDIPPIPSKRGI